MSKSSMVDKPCICFVGPMLGQHPGWVPNPAEYLAARLAERGYACLLVSRKLNRYHRLADILWTLYRHRNEVDIVSLQVYSGASFVVADCASWMSQYLGKPIVMVLHGGDLPTFWTRYPRWGKRVLQRADTVVALSEFLAQSAAALGVRTSVIPNAIDIQAYPFRLRHSAAPKLLWMRTFHEIYNPFLAVDVLYGLRKSHPQATLTMAGQEKGMLAQVRQRVQGLGLEDAVRFTGFLELAGKQREFAAHDIFLNTNRIDNMPVSVVEAAAFGTPIVATRVGGLPYLLSDEEDGLLTAEDDVADMVAAVRRILEEPGLAGKLSQNARNLGELHDWGVILSQWDNLFQSILHQ